MGYPVDLEVPLALVPSTAFMTTEGTLSSSCTTHEGTGHTDTKNYSLFFWNSYLTGQPVILFAKSETRFACRKLVGGALSGSTAERDGSQQSGQRKESNCPVVTTNTSGRLRGALELGGVFRKAPHRGDGEGRFTPSSAVTGCGLILDGEAPPPSRGKRAPWNSSHRCQVGRMAASGRRTGSDIRERARRRSQKKRTDTTTSVEDTSRGDRSCKAEAPQRVGKVSSRELGAAAGAGPLGTGVRGALVPEAGL